MVKVATTAALDSRLVALLRALGVDGVDLRKVVVPITKREKTADTRLVVAEKNKSWQDYQQQLGRLEGFARESHDEFRSRTSKFFVSFEGRMRDDG
jgi:ABC-type Fe2+-enterobactin transport system substrate-binding protein